MSSFFQKLSETAKTSAQKIGAKSSELAATGKMKMEVMQLSSKVKEKKTELGHLIYSSYLEGQEPNKEEVQKFCFEIKDTEDQIGELEKQMKAAETQQIQQSEQPVEPVSAQQQEPDQQPEQPLETVSGKFCPSCGNQGNSSASFCGVCGYKL